MPTVTEHEYAFDVKLFAVVRVKAPSEANARNLLTTFLDAATIDEEVGVWGDSGVTITEASLSTDDDEPLLFEIDGKETDNA